MSSDAKVNSADAAYAQKASSAEVVIQPLGLPKEFRPKHIAIIMDGNGKLNWRYVCVGCDVHLLMNK